MDREGGSHGGSCYYSVLGIRKDASFSDIRTAYRKLAMVIELFPSFFFYFLLSLIYNMVIKLNSSFNVFVFGRNGIQTDTPEAQESPEKPNAGFSKSKKLILDFCDFMQEMMSMMNNVKDEGDSFEDLQRMFAEMVDGISFDINTDPTVTKTARVTASKGNAARRNSSRC
ncbi:hypothetical protein Gotur_011727 [Gossypium turneri]